MTEGWKKDKLGNILELKYGRNLPKTIRSYGSVPVFGSNGIVGYHNEALVKQKGIIVGRKGSAGIVNFSQVPFYPIDTTFYLTQEDTRLDLEFLYYALQKLDLKRILGDVGVPGLNREMAYLEELIFPSDINEQRKIAHVLSTINRALEHQEELINTTIELKKKLMFKLFTEGIRPEGQKESEIGMVPQSWEVDKFENIGEVVYGIQASVANNVKPIGHKILTNKNITLEGMFDLDKINYFKLISKRHFDLILKKGDLLFNWRSGSKEHVGKTAIFNMEEGEYVHSSFILRIRVNRNHNSKFLFYYLNYLREIGYYLKVQTYSINAKFNKSAINAMPIPLPIKETQDKIAEMLEVVDNKINNLKANYNLKSCLLKTMSHELMTGHKHIRD